MENKEEKCMIDSDRRSIEGQENEIILYDYYKILVKRKKAFIGMFLGPLVIVIMIGLSLPRYYRGECEISVPVLPAPNIVNLIGGIDDTKKVKIFNDHSGMINTAIITLSKKSNDKISLVIEAKTPEIIPQASKELFDYINNLPEIEEESLKKQEETDFKIKKAKEARMANLDFLNEMTDMIKKRQLSAVYINPSDLVKKDTDLSLEILALEKIKIAKSKMGSVLIAKHPADANIRQLIIITGILSIIAGFLGVFIFDYIERMKTYEKNKTRLL